MCVSKKHVCIICLPSFSVLIASQSQSGYKRSCSQREVLLQVHTSYPHPPSFHLSYIHTQTPTKTPNNFSLSTGTPHPPRTGRIYISINLNIHTLQESMVTLHTLHQLHMLLPNLLHSRIQRRLILRRNLIGTSRSMF